MKTQLFASEGFMTNKVYLQGLRLGYVISSSL